MEEHISIAKPARDVFSYVADPANLPNWVPQLRRDDANLPEDGLEADAASHRVRWSFDPAGEWLVSGDGAVATLRLTIHAESATPSDPTEDETPAEALAHGMEAALQSLKSHIEGVDGGDPSEPSHDAPSRLYGRTATQDPQI
ncbi:SRPBCC family protein [Roseomonas sp. BN140053]|uniref:SRPBCC family protein n=1 Tax=Roseomonas sp. BN140053 TaxID=3391898 RepID=UPI0039EB80C5